MFLGVLELFRDMNINRREETLRDATQANLVKGFILHMSGSYGKAAGLAAMGPLLGLNSSGIFIKRTVDQWVNGYVDPFTSSRYAPNDPRYLVRAVTKTFPNADLDPATAVDRVPRVVPDVKDWPSYGATTWTLATGQDDPDRAMDVVMSTMGAGYGDRYTYKSSGWTEQVGGKRITNAVYQDVKKAGVNLQVEAWFDVGSSLDMGRKVKLEWKPVNGKVKAHKGIDLYKFHLAEDELLPCPVSTKNCRYSTKYHGSWNVSDHRTIPTVMTMPHGHRADRRMFGFINATDPNSPFKPDPDAHDIGWEVFKLTGNVMGMQLRYQNNFQVKATDTFFPKLWQPAANSSLASDPADGLYVPIVWTDVSFRVGDDVFAGIDAIIKDLTARREPTAVMNSLETLAS